MGRVIGFDEIPSAIDALGRRQTVVRTAADSEPGTLSSILGTSGSVHGH